LLVFSKGRLTTIRQVITDATFAQVKSGMRQQQVRTLLGTPWRITNVNHDADEDIGDVCEYRGRDAGGTYKFHIEYDLHRRVVVSAKVADVAPQDH
jgi:SmpA / OmlA family